MLVIVRVALGRSFGGVVDAQKPSNSAVVFARKWTATESSETQVDVRQTSTVYSEV